MPINRRSFSDIAAVYRWPRADFLLPAVILGLLLLALQPQRAAAVVIILDFDSASKVDAFAQETGVFNHSTFGFSGMTNTEVQQATLAAVEDHFFGYPTVTTDVSSPLPDGKELDIDFEIGLYGSGPSNGDPEYYLLSVGTGLSGTYATNPNIYGAACLDCVRDAAGNDNIYSIPMGTGIGSIWTDHIDNAAYLASTNEQLINLIAGTISHEIGHSLSLIHTGAMSANPGGSSWGVMGSGATSMPNSQRVLEREFTYANMSNLITSVGLRDVDLDTVGVSLVASHWLTAPGLVLLRMRRRRFQPAPSALVGRVVVL